VAAGDQSIGETDEPLLLLSITRGLIRTAGSDLVEADMLRLPDRQGELETPTTRSFDGPWWRRPPVDDDATHTARGKESFWWIIRVDRLERQDTHGV